MDPHKRDGDKPNWSPEGTPEKDSDRPASPNNPILVDYEIPREKVYRELVVPKRLCQINDALLGPFLFGIVYGIIILILGECFRLVGIKFKPAWQPRKRRRF